MNRIASDVVVTLLVLTAAFAHQHVPRVFADDLPTDLSGIWEAHGTTDDAGVVSYTAVVIIKKLNDGYVCQWTAGPGANVLGLAVLHADDTLVVSWGREHLGLSIFKIDEGCKSMSGRWLVLPSTVWRSETLKFVAPLPVKKKLVGT